MPGVSQDPAKQAIWTIESTHPELAEAAENALREVIDPEIGMNVIELGLVREVEYKEEEKKAKRKEKKEGLEKFVGDDNEGTESV